MGTMDRGWKRVGDAVRAARKAQGLTQAELGALIDVSSGTIRAIERGTEFSKVGHTLRALETELGWGPGSIEVLLEGGDPLPPRAGEVVTPETAPGPPTGLPLRVARILAEGATVDTKIVPLSPGAEVVVIVKGKATATPIELQQALAAWEAREGHLERLGEVADDPSES